MNGRRQPGRDPVIEALRAARVKRGISQAELAKLIKVNPVSVAGWENYRRNPTLPRLHQWARALHVRIAIVPVRLTPPKTGETHG